MRPGPWPAGRTRGRCRSTRSIRISSCGPGDASCAPIAVFPPHPRRLPRGTNCDCHPAWKTFTWSCPSTTGRSQIAARLFERLLDGLSLLVVPELLLAGRTAELVHLFTEGHDRKEY